MRAMYHYTRRFPGKGGRVFFDRNDFPWIGEIERNHPVIRPEVEHLLQRREWLRGYSEISRANEFFAPDYTWRSFVVYTKRDIFPIGRKICPATYDLVKDIPAIQTAAFSFLDGKSRLPLHEGIYAGRVRYHLGVVVPGPPDAAGIDLVLNTIRSQTLHPDAFTGLGLDPTARKIVVIKSTQHFYAGFAPIARDPRLRPRPR